MSYTIPSTVQTKAEAVLAVASAIADEDMGARYDGTVNTSLDVLADVLAAQDVDVPQTNAGAILALAQYAHGGGGGGSTVTLDIMEVADAPLSTAYFTVENSSGTQLTITPVTEGDFHYFTITANVGELLTFETVNGSGYRFSSDTKYVMNEDATNKNTYPLYFEMTQVQIVAANDPSAVAPHPYLMLVLTTAD